LELVFAGETRTFVDRNRRGCKCAEEASICYKSEKEAGQVVSD